MRHLSSGILALAICTSVASPQPATVILVRHAEKAAAPADDPALSAAGSQRARDLAAALADAGVDAIVTTQFLRTRATAAPLAHAIGREPIVVAAGADVHAHAEAVAAAVRARPAGETVLVVGHSNTIPAIIEALGGPRFADLCDQQYSSLFVLELPASRSPRLIRASYGASDPAGSDACTHTMRRP